MAPQTITHNDVLFQKVLGIEPIYDLERMTPFPHVILFLFTTFYRKYGNQSRNWEEKIIDGSAVIAFKTDPSKCDDMAGWFVCYGTEFGYHLFFSSLSPIEDFSLHKMLSPLHLAAGYAVGSGEFIVSSSELPEASAVFLINGRLYFKTHDTDFKKDDFFFNIICEDVWPIRAWHAQRKMDFKTEKHL